MRKSRNDREMDQMGKPWIEGEGTKGQGQIHTALQLVAVIYVCFFVASSFPGRCPASSSSKKGIWGGERGDFK